MALKGTHDTIKQAIPDVIAPQLQELRGEIAGLRGEMVGLCGEMNGLRGERRQMEKRVDERMASVEKRMEEGFAAIRVEIAHTHRRIDDVYGLSQHGSLQILL